VSATAPALTAIVARASAKSRDALNRAENEASAWIEAVWSGARSRDRQCVTCGRGGKLEDNHVAGWRHGDLTVPMCVSCHQAFTECQDLWDPRWQVERRTAELDASLLVRGLVDILEIRSRHVSESKAGAYIALRSSLREQYSQLGRRTL
jgi:hypothetical protein